MADLAVRPDLGIAGLALPSHAAAFACSDAGPAARFVFRGASSALGDAFGVALPQTACRAAAQADRIALWLGPDEWLLIAPATEAAPLYARLTAALVAQPASLVDVSHRNVGLILEGSRVADVLNAGCPLDLDPMAFPVGMCTRTIFGKAEVVLWRTAPFAFHLEVWRSFAPYVIGLLGQAARDAA
jgi:sarcosine oxidase subunit gamma